jgi:hypothetical protein
LIAKETAPNRELQHRAEDSDTSRDRSLRVRTRHVSCGKVGTVMGFKPDPLID